MDYMKEIEKMVHDSNLMNSYKLYFLKAIIMKISSDNNEFKFYELACWMCAYAFNDLCKLGSRIRPLDKLYDTILLIIDKEGLLESSNPLEVFNALQTNDKHVRNAVTKLVNYVPYRLLAYLWSKELRGKKDVLKNGLIEMYSKENGRNMYMIVTNGKSRIIIVHLSWKRYLVENQEKLIPWIDNRIKQFVWNKD